MGGLKCLVELRERKRRTTKKSETGRYYFLIGFIITATMIG